MPLEDSNTKEILLSDDGRVFRREIVQREVVMDEAAVFAAMKEGQKTKIRDALLVGKMPTGLCIVCDKTTTIQTYATIPLKFVRFNTGFRMVGDVVVPVFEKPTSSTPRFNVDWDLDKACAGKVRLWFLVKTKSDAGNPNHYIYECYLAATSTSNKTYRIPLSNVYDDCKVCMGDYNTEHPTLQQALDAALEQFLTSPWNADLRKSSEKSDAFFRFKPENAGFETLPVVGQWNNLCERVELPALEFLVLPQAEGKDEIF
jgi:hypothetical protein